MADERSTEAGPLWPLPQFHFRVQWGTDTMSFQEVSGLDVETQPIEYRHGDGPEFSAIGMPGIKKAGKIIMKRGVFDSSGNIRNWLERIETNAIERKAATITLIDESGAPAMRWTLANAWPTKVTGTKPRPEGSEVAIESIEFAHEGLTIAIP